MIALFLQHVATCRVLPPLPSILLQILDFLFVLLLEQRQATTQLLR